MIKRLIFILVTVVFFAAVTVRGQIEPPKLDPVPPTEKQQATIEEGVALHDKRDYDGAISKYKEVLKENQDCVEALFEMSYSYFTKQDYKTAIEISMKGAKYKSRLLARFYEQIGNGLDTTGDTKQAIEYYKAGVAISTKGSLLYFNLAIAYRNQGNVNEFKSNIKRAMVSVPWHPSCHLALGEYYYKAGYKTPAILAYARFLILEPKSTRTDVAYKRFQELMGTGVSQGKDSNTINITLDPHPKTDEGDFGTMELMIGLSKAASMTEAQKGKNQAERFVDQMESFFAVMSETGGKEIKKSFVWDYYSPYFIEMKKRKFVEVFCYYISQKSEDADVQKWLTANTTRVNEFKTWSESFKWPVVEP